MYAWSSDCCVGQAGRKGLVNLFGTLGWQGTCRQVKVPAQSYVSTAAVLEYRLHCNTRDMEGKARRVQGYGYGPGAGAGTTTRYWGLETGTGTGHGTGAWEAGKGGLKVGGREGGERGCGCCWVLDLNEVGGCGWEEEGQNKGCANDRTTSEHFACSAWSEYDDVQRWSMCRWRQTGRCEGRPDVPLAGERAASGRCP